MSKQQLMNRLLSMESRVNSQSMRTGNLKDEDWSKLIESAGVIGDSNLIIDDTPGITVRELRSKCRRYKLEHGLDIIMIDYLQLMSGGGRGSDSRQQEISEISRSLKALARELNVPVVALSQLSRAVESRTDHRPMLSDLRESGAIEQDADVVMFIYRDDYYKKDSDMKGIAEIIIAKQRNGPIGTVNLVWLPDYYQIYEPGAGAEISFPRSGAESGTAAIFCRTNFVVLHRLDAIMKAGAAGGAPAETAATLNRKGQKDGADHVFRS